MCFARRTSSIFVISWELNLQPWDTAAGRVIAEEAGARITDFQGNPFSTYMKEILASNGRIHGEMQTVIQNVIHHNHS